MPHLLRKLLYVSPFLFAAYFFRFEALGVPLTLTELYSYGLFILWLFSLKGVSDFKRSPSLTFYYGLAGLIFIGVSLGVLQAPGALPLPDGSVFYGQRAALGVWKGWVIAPLLYFVVVTQVLRGPEDARKLLRSFVYSAAAVSLLAYGFALFGDGVTYDFRLAGFFESANHLALYIAPAVALNFCWFLHPGALSRRQRIVDVVTCTVLLHALFFTQSYAAILAVSGSLVFYAFYVMIRDRQRSRKAFFGLVALFAGLVLAVATQFGSPKFRQFLDFENRSSTTVRFEIYQVASRLIRDHWFFGHGPGLFQTYYQNAAPMVLNRSPMEWNIPHPHNLFFAFWLNAGLLGLIGFLGIVWKAHQRFSYALLPFWAIVLHGFFDTPFWKNDLAMIFWLIVGVIALLQNHKSTASQD